MNALIRVTGLLATAVCALASCVALAAEPALDASCLECHRGALPPKIEGQHAKYLETQLLRFRDLHRPSYPMSTVASAFDDDNARAWAQALAVRPWRNPKRSVGTARGRAAGAALAESRGCANCHGADFRGTGDIPRLAGQRAPYIERQLRDFGKNHRYHMPLEGGRHMHALDADEGRHLAAFLASLTPPP